jgi:sugar O-acyltransferase (sialic acid O-acetyltransferase NeuD family)
MKKKEIIIIGCGGQGKVILDILKAQQKKVCGFIDDDTSKHNSKINNIKVLGNIEYLLEKRITNKVAIAIGDNLIRSKIFDLLKKNNFNTVQAIHPSAIISKNVSLGESVIIMPGAVINTNVIIEDNVIINTKASVDHDCIIKKHSQVQPGATITGRVTIGEFATIGSGAIILPNLSVGKKSFVGAGAVVTKDVSDNVMVVGVPAKKIKKIKNKLKK